MMAEKITEFHVNNLLTLKLEDDKTNIYIAGNLIRQCKYLLINIPVEKVSSFDELESIDEAAEKLDHSLEPRRDVKQFAYSLPPEVEFWGHCSNLQVWYENGYNTRLLHANLAFPLLRELSRLGDPQAKKIFKEEVAERYNYGVESVREYLRSKKYLRKLTTEEFLGLIQDENDRETIEQLREVYPRFEKHERGGMTLKINLDIKNGRVVKVDLRGLKMGKIPVCVRNLTQLEHLNVSYNLLETLPEWIDELQDLKVLIITDNQFKTLPQIIGELSNLEELYARGNQLETLPESIGKLQSLRILELYQNNLKVILESIGNLTNLKLLDLHENNLTILHDSIGNLKNLKKLRLQKNRIQNLPSTIGELRNLRSLNLSYNILKTLPESIGNLTMLKLLAVSYNPLNRIPSSLYKLPNLMDLWVMETPLKEYRVEKMNFINELIEIHYKKNK